MKWTRIPVAALCLAVTAQLALVAQDSPEQEQVDFANSLFSHGFYEEAADEYSAYLEKYPKGSHVDTALYRLGWSAYAARDYPKALDAFDRLLARPGEGLERRTAQLRKGEILTRLGRGEEGVAVLEPLTAADVPEEVRVGALYHLGRAYREMKRPDDAARSLGALADNFPNSELAPFARHQLAFVYLDQGDAEKAAVEFSAVAVSGAAPALRAESQFRAAETYDKIGWYEAAAAAYQKLTEDFPESDYVRRAVYGHAWALYHAGQFERALQMADQFLADQPDSPNAPGMKYLRGNCLQQARRLDEATAAYRAIMDQHGDSEFAARAQYKMAWIAYLRGDTEEARRIARAFLDSHAESELKGDAGFLLGTVEAEAGNHQDAYEEFRLVAERYPDSEFGPEALFKAGETLARLGRDEDAAAAFEAFAKQYPENPLSEQAVLRAGDAEFFRASFEEAVARYRAILDGEPQQPVLLETLYRLAVTHHNMRDYGASAEMFRKLLEADPGGPRTAEANLRIANHLLNGEKDLVRAMARYQAAYDAEPEGPYAGRALRGLALARYETNDHAGAADLFMKVVREYPDVPLSEETYAWLGQKLFDEGRFEESAAVFTALLARSPAYPHAGHVRFKAAEATEKAGALDDALKRYTAVVEADPHSDFAVEARFRMGAVYEAQGKKDGAYAMYEAAAGANTGEASARARFHLGELKEQDGDYTGAARDYMRIAILFLHEELSPEAFLRAGRCFQQAGQAPQAARAYEQLIRQYPEASQKAEAEQRLAELRATADDMDTG